MKLHTKLNAVEVREALLTVKDHGLVAPSVYFEQCDERGSRSRTRAFDIKLACATKYKNDGRRRANSGNHGSAYRYTATYDEWGFFIAEIFERDPEAVFGNYNGRDDFENQTHGAYVRYARR
jgi:hypothetical protein